MSNVMRNRKMFIFSVVWIALLIGTIAWRSFGYAENTRSRDNDQSHYYEELVKRLVEQQLDSKPLKTLAKPLGMDAYGVDETAFSGVLESFNTIFGSQNDGVYACLAETLTSSEHTEYVDISFELEGTPKDLLTGKPGFAVRSPTLERSSQHIDIYSERCLVELLEKLVVTSDRAPKERIFYRFCINRRTLTK